MSISHDLILSVFGTRRVELTPKKIWFATADQTEDTDKINTEESRLQFVCNEAQMSTFGKLVQRVLRYSSTDLNHVISNLHKASDKNLCQPQLEMEELWDHWLFPRDSPVVLVIGRDLEVAQYLIDRYMASVYSPFQDMCGGTGVRHWTGSEPFLCDVVIVDGTHLEILHSLVQSRRVVMTNVCVRWVKPVFDYPTAVVMFQLSAEFEKFAVHKPSTAHPLQHVKYMVMSNRRLNNRKIGCTDYFRCLIYNVNVAMVGIESTNFKRLEKDLIFGTTSEPLTLPYDLPVCSSPLYDPDHEILSCTHSPVYNPGSPSYDAASSLTDPGSPSYDPSSPSYYPGSPSYAPGSPGPH